MESSNVHARVGSELSSDIFVIRNYDFYIYSSIMAQNTYCLASEFLK